MPAVENGGRLGRQGFYGEAGNTAFHESGFYFRALREIDFWSIDTAEKGSVER